MRGSDPQAAVYYLARMLEAGEDARFIARRMIIFASEDVGMADPQALLVAVAAAHALEHVGLPEAQLNLSQAAIHLATAPKSNRAALAIWNARERRARRRDRRGPGPPPRRALPGGRSRSATAPATSTLMTTPDGWVAQQYLPDEHRRASGTTSRATTASRRGGRADAAQERERTERRWTDAMTAGELALVIAAVLCCIGFAALIVVLVRVLDTLRSLRSRGRDAARRDRRRCSPSCARPPTSAQRGRQRGAATISIASTACSVRPRRSATRCRGSGRVARAALEHAGDQDRRAGHGHVTRRPPPARQGNERRKSA